MFARRASIVVGLTAILGYAVAAWADDKATDSITGKVVYAGTAPKAKTINASGDAHCAKLHEKDPLLEETFVVGKNGELANVFVQVSGGPLKGKTFEPPAKPAEIDQKGCCYHPHVVVIQVGQTLKIINSDETNHNIHGVPKDNKAFNLLQPRKGQVNEVKLTKPEIFPINCDVHQWMHAWAHVVTNPFWAVTDEKGEFAIKGLEPGEYQLDFFHEGAKFTTKKVKVEAGKATKLEDVKFTPKKPGTGTPVVKPKPVNPAPAAAPNK